MNFSVSRIAAAAAALAIMSGTALAHTGVSHADGFSHGFMHPIGGLDHVLAMIAVGLLAANLGGRALWLVPVAFVAVMAAGGALGMAGVSVPFVESGIAVSIVVLGFAVALRVSLPTIAAMALVGVFAIFHGHAHGAEMPADASGASYAAGFLLATALLHAAGIALGLGIARIGEFAGRRAVQAAGGAMAVAGIVILTRLV